MKSAAWVVSAWVAVSSAAAFASTCDRSPLLVRQVDVWSPTRLDRARDVLIVDGRVAKIARTGKIKSPPNTRVLEGRGALMLPGLIDMHVHFGFGGMPRPENPALHPWGDAAVTGRHLLMSGVTTTRLHLDSIKWATVVHGASQDVCNPLPRVYAGGPAFIPGSPTHDEWAVWSVTGVEDAIAKVRRLNGLRFEWIAFHEAHKFSDDERNALVGTARSLGMRVLGSGYTQADVDSSLGIRPDTIDYLDVSATPEYDPQLLVRARQQRQLTWVARLGVHERYKAYQANPQLLDDPRFYEFLTTADAEAVRAGIAAELSKVDGDHSKRMAASYPTLRRKFSQLRASGVPLAAGTDVGSTAMLHRDAIWWEIKTWVEYGASVNEALTAVTVNAARALANPDIGHLREGARADFVLTSPKLLEGAIDARDVRAVAKAGVLMLNESWVGPVP